jgi:hypothetical protein
MTLVVVDPGVPYFTPEDLRDAYEPLTVDRYSDEKLTRAHDAVVATIERVCHTSFVTRTYTDTRFADGTRLHALDAAYVQEIVSVTVDGILVESGVQLQPGDTLLRDRPWPSGQTVAVTYRAGATATCPADLKDAGMEAARQRLLERNTAGVPSRALSITNEFGNVNLASASADRPFGIPDVDAVIIGYRNEYRVPVTA